MENIFSDSGNVWKHMGMSPWPQTRERQIGLKTYIEHPTSGQCSKCRTNQTAWVEINRTRKTVGPARCDTCQLDYACELLTKGSQELTFKSEQIRTFAEQVMRLNEAKQNLETREVKLQQRVNELERLHQAASANRDRLQKLVYDIGYTLWDSATWRESDILPYIQALVTNSKTLVAIAKLVVPLGMAELIKNAVQTPPQKAEPKKPEPWGGILPKPKDWDRVTGINPVTSSVPTSASISWGGEDLSIPKKR